MEAYELAHLLIKEEFGDIEIWASNAHLCLDNDGIPELSFWFQKEENDDHIERTYKFGLKWSKIDTR